MKILQMLIPTNQFSRTGRPLDSVKAIVLHNLGVPGQSARDARNYWAGLASQDAMDSKPDISASAHYVIDFTGTVIMAVPENERAYHVGSGVVDPASGRIYTDKAREVFGEYAANPLTMSPNRVALGIELCHLDQGRIPETVLKTAEDLCVELCLRYQLDPIKKIMGHWEIVGWKRCPQWFYDHPGDFKAFKERVANRLNVTA